MVQEEVKNCCDLQKNIAHYGCCGGWISFSCIAKIETANCYPADLGKDLNKLAKEIEDCHPDENILCQNQMDVDANIDKQIEFWVGSRNISLCTNHSHFSPQSASDRKCGTDAEVHSACTRRNDTYSHSTETHTNDVDTWAFIAVPVLFFSFLGFSFLSLGVEIRSGRVCLSDSGMSFGDLLYGQMVGETYRYQAFHLLWSLVIQD